MALVASQERKPPQPKFEEIVLRPPRIGVVTFNDTIIPTAGLACVGHEKPIGFDRRTDLPSDVLWISDAKDAVSAQNFRPALFLRSSVAQIATDLGVTLRTYDGIRAVAETVANARDIFAQSYKWRDFSSDWSHADMPTAIAKILPAIGEALPSMESPLMQSVQTYSFVPDARPDAQNQAIFTLRTNRLRYAQYILSISVPGSAWRSIHDFAKSGLSIDSLLDINLPSLSEVTIEFTTSFRSAATPALVAFGAGAKNGKQPIRKWVSQIELAWLIEHAKVNIQSAYICEGAERLTQAYTLPQQLTHDPLLALSVAAGLVSECHWVGLSMPTTVRRAGNSATAKFQKIMTPPQVWLRAADRAYSFAMAKVVAERGYQVSGYGYGGVSFYAPKDGVTALMELADEIGACHPCLSGMLGQKSNLPDEGVQS